MYSGVATLTQAHQVFFRVCAALGDRHDVMDLIHQRHAPFPVAHLTERMLGGIAVTDPLPGAPVFPVDIWRAGILVVLPVRYFSVLFAVPSVREFRASGVRARAFRFLWHCLLQIKKLQGINLRAWFCS